MTEKEEFQFTLKARKKEPESSTKLIADVTLLKRQKEENRIATREDARKKKEYQYNKICSILYIYMEILYFIDFVVA